MGWQLIHARLRGEVEHKCMELYNLGGLKLWRGIGAEQLVDTYFGAFERVQRAALLPGAHRIPVDDCARDVLLLLEELERDFLLEEITALEVHTFVEAGSDGLGM